MDNIAVRESIIFSFLTHSDKVRTLNVPDPMSWVDAETIIGAADRIIAADVFDEAMGSGSPASLMRAIRERVESTILF